MKRIIIIIAMALIPFYCQSQPATPCTDCDTIPSRYDKYYYYQWYDECPMFGVTDSCWYEWYRATDSECRVKYEHTNSTLKVKGLVALVLKPWEPYASPTKLPEYMYLYQEVGKHYYNDIIGEEYLDPDIVYWVDLQMIDSVRWDTAKPHYMEIDQGGTIPNTQYVYAYEAYFENPVYVDSDFYIRGSAYSTRLAPGSTYISQYIPTHYMRLRCEFERENKECTLPPYHVGCFYNKCPEGKMLYYCGYNEERQMDIW